MIQMNLHAALGAGTFPTNQIGSLPLGQSQRVAAKPRATTARNTFYNDDAGLVEACLAGDDAAWEKLVRRYTPLVYSIPRRFGLPTIDADDVLQTVFTIAFRQLHSLKNRRCLAAWLITITRREMSAPLQTHARERGTGRRNHGRRQLPGRPGGRAAAPPDCASGTRPAGSEKPGAAVGPIPGAADAQL